MVKTVRGGPVDLVILAIFDLIFDLPEVDSDPVFDTV
jgi:hypothetical protein